MGDSTHSEPDRLVLFSVTANASVEGTDLRKTIGHHFVEHRDHLYLYLLACGASPADADDLTQDTFLRLFRHLRAGKPVEKLQPWLFRVARNLLLDRRKGNQYLSAGSEIAWAVWQDTVADPSVNLEQATLTEEKHAQLDKAFQTLTPLQIQYLHLRAEGLRHREIAEIYGVAVSTVVDVVRRAVEKLGKEME